MATKMSFISKVCLVPLGPVNLDTPMLCLEKAQELFSFLLANLGLKVFVMFWSLSTQPALELTLGAYVSLEPYAVSIPQMPTSFQTPHLLRVSLPPRPLPENR